MHGVYIHFMLWEDIAMRHESGEMEMQAVMQTAARMCAAARTAPKGHGRDTLHTLVLTGEDKEALARKMEEVGLRDVKWAMRCPPGMDGMLPVCARHRRWC